MSKKIIFLRTAWMIDYRGVTEDDIPSGAGHFVDENADGGEVVNFLPVRNRFYGYARMQNDRNFNIARLGARHEDQFLDGVTVVFFAKNPFLGGQYVIGWYENARFFRSTQQLRENQRPGYVWYICYTSRKNGVLIPVEDRNFKMPADGPGQTNAWYPMEYANRVRFFRQLSIFMKNPALYGRKKRKTSRWRVDAEKRKAIEIAAMDATERWFTAKGFIVKYVHKENLGWDMEAESGNVKLKLEVKGKSGALNTIELTPNEYNESGLNADYHICIAEYALNPKKVSLHIFRLDRQDHCWRADTGKKLAILPVTSARLQLF